MLRIHTKDRRLKAETFHSFRCTLYRIISDIYSTAPGRQLWVNLAYSSMGLGALVFTFNAEREVELKHHIFSIILMVLLVFVAIDFFIMVIDPVYIVMICWIPFIILLLTYIIKEPWGSTAPL